MSNDFRIPIFSTEDEEANWWFDNQNLVAERFELAAANGTLTRGKLKERFGTAQDPGVTVEIDGADVQLARQAAARHGETFEAFVRRVVHEALELEKSA